MYVQMAQHKAFFFLSSGGMHFFSDIFSLLSLGHRVTRQGHYGFMSHLTSLQGHLNFGIFLVGISFHLPPFTSSSLAHRLKVLKFFAGSTERNNLFFDHSLATVPFIGLLGNHILGSQWYQLIDSFPHCLEKKNFFFLQVKKKTP